MEAERAAVSVVLVEDHPLFRYALEQTVRGDERLRLVASCGDGREGLEAIDAAEPDVALVDLDLPRVSGMEILAAIATGEKRTKTVVLTGTSDGETIYAALEAGAAGFLTKEIEPDAICNAVLAAARGETVLPRGLQGSVVREIRARLGSARPTLTQREHDIVALVAQGCSASEIAAALHVSEGTVKTHLSHVYEKLGVSDRAAAVAQAIKHGLVEID